MLSIRKWTRHTKVLLIAGLIYVAIGVTFLTSRNELKLSLHLKLAFEIFPSVTWGGIFIGVGLLAMLAALSRHKREVVGYSLLTGLSFGWSGVYAMTYIWRTTNAVDLVQSFTWFLMGAMWIGISGLISPESISVKHMPAEEDADDQPH